MPRRVYEYKGSISYVSLYACTFCVGSYSPAQYVMKVYSLWYFPQALLLQVITPNYEVSEKSL